MELLGDILQLVVVALCFGFIIFFHELGHLLAGIWRGMHIDRFSVGFGPAIWKTEFRGIEYWLSWIPLGGYVALPQLDVADNPTTMAGDPLPQASPLDRIIVALAGPVFNIILGFIVAVVVWKGGILALPQQETVRVSYVQPDTPEARAGLQVGDYIETVDGETFRRGWEEVMEKIIYAEDKHMVLGVVRQGEPMTIEYELEPNEDTEGLWVPKFRGSYQVQVSGVIENSPADGVLKPADVIHQIDGTTIHNADDLKNVVRASQGKELSFDIERDGQQIKNLTLTPRKPMVRIKQYMVGIEFGANLWVTSVDDGTPATQAGLQAGDGIATVNGVRVLTLAGFEKLVEEAGKAQEPVSLTIFRDNEALTIDLQPGETAGTDHKIRNLTGMALEERDLAVTRLTPDMPAAATELKTGDRLLRVDGAALTGEDKVLAFIEMVQEKEDAAISVTVQRGDEEIAVDITPEFVEERENPDFGIGVMSAPKREIVHPTPMEQMWRTVDNIQKMLRRIANRNNPIQLKHMSTFPGIAAVMKSSLSDNIMNFLHLVVFINFMLAIVNLFPFPVLDGGHIVMGLFEGLSGKKLPVRFMVFVQNACVFVLLSLMIYILVYDVNRVGKRVVNHFDKPAETYYPPANPPPPPDPVDTGHDTGSV